MKKFYIIFALLIFTYVANQAFADDLGMNDSVPTVENAWYGQKPVTDEEFEKTITKLHEKKNKKKNKSKMKGQSLNKVEEVPGNYMNEISDKNLLLTLPLELTTPDGQDIPIGHYNVVGRKDRNKVYLDFRQSHSLIATVEARESESDFGESTINFVKLLPYDETKVKLIYGSLDFNAATFLNIKNNLSD